MIARRVRRLSYTIHDAPVIWFYRFWYCRRHGHKVKFGSFGQCINCGRYPGERKPGHS